MASGQPPHGMDQAPILRFLEQQNARSFGISRIILNQFRGFHSFDEFSCKQSLSG